MAQRESRKSRQIMTEIRKRGWFCFKVHGSEFMMAGLPDVIVCAEGYFIALETKHEETRTHTKARQERVMFQITEAGGHAQVATSVGEAIEAIEEALSARRAGRA